MEDLDYLQPDFDPATLTVPRLRSLLVEYDVAWPSSAKKPQLIDLFNQHIAPKARKILSARTRTQRTSLGITDAASLDGDDVEDREATPQPRRSGRQSRAATEESTVSVAPSVASRASRSTRRSSARLSEAPESEVEAATPARSTSRRSKKLINTPAAVKEEPEDESPFTQDNPFQSGSSPQAAPQIASRRRTTGFTSEKKSRTSTTRRKTDLTPTASIPQSRRSGAFEAYQSKEESDDSDDDQAIDDTLPGEEFTAEEAELLKLEEDEQGKQLLPTRRAPARKSGNTLKIAPIAILLAIGGGFFTKWREEKIAVGYCDVGRPSSSLAGIDLPEWADIVLPVCEPCPPHATCYPSLRTTCDPDFILHPHPLSLAGLVPLPPSCEPDSEKAKRVQHVANKVVEELRERNAKFECGELKSEDGKRMTSPEAVEEEIKTVVASKRKKGMSNSEFEDLWRSAIGEVEAREEVVSQTNGTHRSYRSTSLARVPFTCAIRRSVRLTLAKYIRHLGLIFAAIGILIYGYVSLTISRATEARAKQLASFAFKRLSTQASLHAEGRLSEPYISVGQLRDDVLREEFSRSRREKLWKRVVSKVENNSNIRPRVTETRTGEVTRVWEWIGAIERIENSPTSPTNQIEQKRPLY